MRYDGVSYGAVGKSESLETFPSLTSETGVLYHPRGQYRVNAEVWSNRNITPLALRSHSEYRRIARREMIG